MLHPGPQYVNPFRPVGLQAGCGIGKGLGIREQAFDRSPGEKFPWGLVDEGRQAIIEAGGIKPVFVLFLHRLGEFHWEEFGGRPELQASPSKVTDGFVVH